MTHFLKNTSLWLQTLIAVILGVGIALWVGPNANMIFNPIASLFIKLIKMLVVPLVFFTIASSLARLGRADEGAGTEMIKLTMQTILWFMLTSLIAVLVGLALGGYFQPGKGMSGLVPEVMAPKIIPPALDVFMGIVPSNILASFVEGKVLSVMFVALLVGAALAGLGDKARELSNVLEQATQVMFKLTRWVMKLTPLGVFGLIGSVVASYGLESLMPLFSFIIYIYLGCLIILLIIYPALLKLHGLSVRAFYKAIFDAQQTAFFTCSSLGTLPVSMQVATENLKLPKSYAGFALPLGANMKMDGCGAIYPAIASIFIANYFGVDLTMQHYILIVISSVLGSLATAGVPGVATVMLTFTLSTAGLPLEGIALLASIDRIIDMIRTATNVTGQILVPTLVARENGLVEKGSPLLKN